MNRERERAFFMNGLIMIHPKCLLKKEKKTIDDGEASSNPCLSHPNPEGRTIPTGGDDDGDDDERNG